MIKLVRHGQSAANANGYNNRTVADSKIELTDLGRIQARDAGNIVGADFLKGALMYCSPYTRARQTMMELCVGAGVTDHEYGVYEDPRLREMDHGYATFEEQEELWKTHGQFYYRFNGGESPADCYDRVSSFIESLFRQTARKVVFKTLIVTHGITIRCFVARFLHMSVEQFESIANPKNGAIITIAHRNKLENPIFTCGKWGVEGVELRETIN